MVYLFGFLLLYFQFWLDADSHAMFLDKFIIHWNNID